MVCREQKGLDKLLPGFCPNGVWAIWGPGRFCLCSFGGCPHLYALWTPPSRVKLSCVFGRGSWPKVPDLIWFSLKHHWADDVCVCEPSHHHQKHWPPFWPRFARPAPMRVGPVDICFVCNPSCKRSRTATDLHRPFLVAAHTCMLSGPHPVESSSLVCLARDPLSL